MSLKPKIQGALRRAGLLNRLRASPIYDLYWRIADPQLVAARRQEALFYRNVLSLRKNDLIFDIGANNGTKAQLFLHLGARVIAIEPDQANQLILKEKFLRYRMHRPPIVIVGKAVGQTSGTAKMLVESPGSALNTLNPKWAETLKKENGHFSQTMGFKQSVDVEVTTIEDLIKDYGMPSYVKIDAEGYEIHVLRGMRRPVPQLSFEINLPEFRQEGLECLDISDGLAAGGTFNYVADYGQGMALDGWLGRAEMAKVVKACVRPSIEVFWRAPANQC